MVRIVDASIRADKPVRGTVMLESASADELKNVAKVIGIPNWEVMGPDKGVFVLEVGIFELNVLLTTIGRGREVEK